MDKFRSYSRRFFTPEQRAWCWWYERTTGFEPVFDGYEEFDHQGGRRQTWEDVVEWNLQWFEDWTGETLGCLRRGFPDQA